MKKYILALDQGTTSSRAIVFDHQGSMVNVVQKEFEQIFPKPGWVEHNAKEIWKSQIEVAFEAIIKAGLEATDIDAIGITNQRETTVIWNRETGEPIHNAIVWQDRRTSEFCRELDQAGHADMFKKKTGLVLDAYFSGTKVKWLLDNVEGARDLANQGKLAFGTIDSWLVWNLTNGEKHVTDVTNASRTLLFNIHTLEWDQEILELLDIPESLLPTVRSSSEVYGETRTSFMDSTAIPIAGIAGDQQAALFGQMCVQPGMLKNTYGTGAFIIVNTGTEPIESKNNLLTTIGWQINGETTYALEGSVFIAGAVVQWLRDGLGIIKTSAEVEELANKVDDNGDVYFVPAFAGLGAPHWDQFARGSIVGMTRGTTAGHIARAALESIAFQTLDVIEAMEADSGIKIKELRVDGGATANDTLMQFQSDILGIPLIRPKVAETTALGAAYLAGLATGFWKDVDDIKNQWQEEKSFGPKMEAEKVQTLTKNWRRAVERSKDWIVD
jgi:glycerol kinase